MNRDVFCGKGPAIAKVVYSRKKPNPKVIRNGVLGDALDEPFVHWLKENPLEYGAHEEDNDRSDRYAPDRVDSDFRAG